MALRVVGAGLPRTGTHSLKLALEKLLGQPCYHMFELFENLPHVPVWTGAVRGVMPAWDEFLGDYAAAVDFPAAAFWPELMEAFPDAVVLLSVRETRSWWTSMSRTVIPRVRELPTGPVKDMIYALWSDRLTTRIDEEGSAKEAFESFNNRVRSSVPEGRLLEWWLGDGWEPICQALSLPVPRDAFPHVNTTEEFLSAKVGPSLSGRRSGAFGSGHHDRDL